MKINVRLLSILLAGLMTLSAFTTLTACDEDDSAQTEAGGDIDESTDDKKDDSAKEDPKLPSELYASILKAEKLTVTSHTDSGSFTTDYVLKWDGRLLYWKNTTDLYVPGMNENEEYYIDVATGTKYNCKNGVWTKEEGEPASIETILDDKFGITESAPYVDVQYADYDSKTGRYNMTEEMVLIAVGSADLLGAVNYVAYIAETENGFERIMKHDAYAEVAETDMKLVVTFECEELTLPEM